MKSIIFDFSFESIEGSEFKFKTMHCDMNVGSSAIPDSLKNGFQVASMSDILKAMGCSYDRPWSFIGLTEHELNTAFKPILKNGGNN